MSAVRAKIRQQRAMVTSGAGMLPRMGGKQDIAFWAFGVPVAFTVGAAGAMLGYWALLPIPVLAVGLLIAVLWRRAGHGAAPPATPNPVLIAAPTALAATALGPSIGATAVAALAVIAFWPRRSRGGLHLAFGSVALPLTALAVLRPNTENAEYRTVFFVTAALILARAVTLSASKPDAVTSLIDGVGLFVVASLALWLAGVSGESLRTAGIDGGNTLTGGTRVVFPLSTSLAATGSMAAVYLAAALPVLIMHRTHRLPRVVAVLSAAAVCILSDTRSAILAGVLLAGFVLLAPKLFRRAAPWLAGFALAVPFIYAQIQATITAVLAVLNSVAPWLARPTLRGRESIWPRALHHYSERVDWVDQMIGFGMGGQARSGASSYYGAAARFEGFGGDPRNMSPHNSMLQILFDGGWIMAGVVAAVILGAAFVLRSDLAGLVMLVALAVVSVTEVALSPAHMQPTWWVLVALSMIAFAKAAPETFTGVVRVRMYSPPTTQTSIQFSISNAR